MEPKKRFKGQLEEEDSEDRVDGGQVTVPAWSDSLSHA